MGLFDRIVSAAKVSQNTSNEAVEDLGVDRLIESGHALQERGCLDEAMQCYVDAVRIARSPARAHLNRGNVMLLKGDLPGALEAFREAIRHKQDYAGAYYNIGNALLAAGELDQALQNYRAALDIQPDYAAAHCSMGIALKALGRIDEAVSSLRTALQIAPGMGEAVNGMGGLLEHLYSSGMNLMGNGKPVDAVTSFSRVLEIEPNLAEAHFNLGNAQKMLGQNEAAAKSYRRAVEIRPEYAEAYGSLGVVLHDLWNFEEEVASYRRALAINPGLAEVHSNMGVALKESGMIAESEESYRRALEIAPDSGIFRAVHAFTLPIAPQSIPASEGATLQFDRALQDLGDWLAASPANRERFSGAVGLQHPFYLAYRNGNHIERLSRYGDMVSPADQQNLANPDYGHAKIRMAVVSDHFRRHSVWDVIIRGILTNLDRSRFEVLLYSMSHAEDGETQFARLHCDVWRDARTVVGFDGWLEAIKNDKPDVIFYPEIGMNTMTLRLAARRLAHLQIASWGHPITTGLPTIDIFLSGELLEAPDADGHYREKLVRLPGTGCCTTPIGVGPDTVPEIELELAKRTGARFLIAQAPFKFDPADDSLFADIAADVGECTFILPQNPQFSWANEQLFARIGRAFRDRNIDPKRHLLPIPWLPRGKFYALLDLCDVYLDCPSFSGYTTAWQAVHRGLPVVTLEGDFLRQRLAAGLLRRIGMIDTIAGSRDEYREIAARIATECNNAASRGARRKAVGGSASQADHDTLVVKAFEQTIIDTLSVRQDVYRSDSRAQNKSHFSSIGKGQYEQDH